MTLEPFLATFTGGKFYPLGPRPEDVRIEDIAHSLSQQCRYAGHTREFWSVAAHSLEVSRRIEFKAVKAGGGAVKRLALTALLHDASESYLLDIPKPIKPLVLLYDQWEDNVQHAIARRFNLAYPFPDIIHEVDKGIVQDEIATFFPEGSEAWKRYGITRGTRLNHAILIPLPPEIAEQRFLERFYALSAGMPATEAA